MKEVDIWATDNGLLCSQQINDVSVALKQSLVTYFEAQRIVITVVFKKLNHRSDSLS